MPRVWKLSSLQLPEGDPRMSQARGVGRWLTMDTHVDGTARRKSKRTAPSSSLRAETNLCFDISTTSPLPEPVTFVDHPPEVAESSTSTHEALIRIAGGGGGGAPWADLYNELLAHVFGFLCWSLKDLASALQTCRRWHDCGCGNGLWIELHKNTFGGPKREGLLWKDYFLENHVRWKAFAEKTRDRRVWLAQNGHLRLLQTLFQSESISMMQEMGLYLGWGASKGHLSTVQWALENMSVPAATNKLCLLDATSLYHACLSGHVNIAEFLIGRGADINMQQRQAQVTALFVASQGGHLQLCEFLIRAGAEVNKANINGATPLFIASENGHTATVALLLRSGANVDSAKTNLVTPLWMACHNGHADVVGLLLKHGANADSPRSDGTAPLYMASYKGYPHVAAQLLLYGASIETEFGTTEKTPLITAANANHIEMVELLLQAGANAHKTTRDGVTALSIACQKGHSVIVDLLLRAGACVNAGRVNGLSPLMCACRYGHVQIVGLLIAAGADVNGSKQDATNTTTTTTTTTTATSAAPATSPLYEATVRGYLQIVLLLLSKGATVEAGFVNSVKSRCGSPAIINALKEKEKHTSGSCVLS
eukprot:TRINITY_DN2281_c2_g1_i1.p2 TRINITY_DN2281_c2_g1~~TRINITY_DN2281_c2_g1_i1.p2  ORF type:complete len:597 (-),score=36.96 TRINITY_DN2281_c2_g1_i1:55-1845(-)